MKLPSRDASKLFHVLVVGGMSMGIPVAACSDGTTGGQDAQANDSGGGGNDSSAPKDSGAVQDVVAADAPCLNKPGDCTHGLCSW